MVTGVGHRGHDEAMVAGGREFSIHGRVVKCVGDAMEAMMKLFGGRSGVQHPWPSGGTI